MSMLLETQWLVVMGTKGTCKTSLASGLARHLARSLDQDGEEEEHIVNFNLDKDGMEVCVCVCVFYACTYMYVCLSLHV